MSSAMHVLSYEEVSRLDQVLERVIQVNGRGNFPTLEVKPKEFILLLLKKIKRQNMEVTDIRLNGSTASYVLGRDSGSDSEGEGEEEDYTYNDLDLIFNMELSSMSHFHQVKSSVLETLIDFLPSEVAKDRISDRIVKEAYIKKMVKVTNRPDTWSLISLTNNEGRHIELKFVDTMRRKFEFSVDSFQIILDSLLDFQSVSSDGVMTPVLYPSVVSESVYGDFKEALYHLHNKLIATKNPEEIRGGGLLKYCSLLARDFCQVDDSIRGMEKYMCSRFFIDFKDVPSQQRKLETYLQSHLLDSPEKRYNYLMILYSVVEDSTVCLMSHERRQTLRMILDLANQVFAPQPQCQQITVYYTVPPYMQSQHGRLGSSNQPEYVMLGTWQTPTTTDQNTTLQPNSSLVPCF